MGLGFVAACRAAGGALLHAYRLFDALSRTSQFQYRLLKEFHSPLSSEFASMSPFDILPQGPRNIWSTSGRKACVIKDMCGVQPDENPAASLGDINVCPWSSLRLSELTSCILRVATRRSEQPITNLITVHTSRTRSYCRRK